MEEILASIRRIIEDSDTARKPLDDIEPQLADPQSMASRPAVAESAAEHEVEVFQAELREPAEPQATAASWGAEEAPAAPTPHHDVFAPAAADPARAATFDAPAFADAPEASRDDAADRPVPVVRASVAAIEPQPEEGRPVLMSDHAGRQVAAAFGELSEAFAASRRRSFDEMAEEMLRPMLQDWLDNNLPTLVERLVREEIERVARGG